MSLDNEQYVAKGGLLCPVCETPCSVEGGLVEVDGGVAYQNVNCTVCESTWTDLYALTGFDSLVKGDE